jgi:transposase
LDKIIPDAFKSAFDKLKCISETPEKELFDFVSNELLLSADQLKMKYQKDSANKGIREKEHQFQVLIRFELALLCEDASDLFSEVTLFTCLHVTFSHYWLLMSVCYYPSGITLSLQRRGVKKVFG